MSEPVSTAPAIAEPVVAPIVDDVKPIESAPATTEAVATSDAVVPPTVDEPATAAPESPVAPIADEAKADDAAATSSDEAKADEKEKKKGSKALGGLLAKFRKPAKDEKAVEKDATPAAASEDAPAVADAAPAAEVSEPVAEGAVPEAEAVATDETAAAAATSGDAIAETPNTGATTPTKKEKASFLDRFFKKSPKAKKAELAPEAAKGDETTPEAAAAEVPVTEPVADAPPTLDEPVSTEAVAAESPVVGADSTPAVESEKKEDAQASKKPNKDLAKLARRLSGKFFGSDKKADKAVKAGEATKEEEEPVVGAADAKTEEAVVPTEPEVAAPIAEPTLAAASTEEPSLVPQVDKPVEATPAIAATA